MNKNLPKSKKSNHKNLALTAFLSSVFIWALAAPIVKITVNELPAIEFLFYRFLITCILITPFIIFELKKTYINSKDIPTLFLLGLLGYGSLLFLFEGLRFASVIDSAIISVISPIIIAYSGRFFYKDKISPGYKLGMFLSALGMFLVIAEPALMQNHGLDFAKRIYGNLLILAYNLCYALYIVLSKEVMGTNSSKLDKILIKLKIKKSSTSIPPFLHTGISFYVALLIFTVLILIKAAIGNTQVVTFSELIYGDYKVIFGVLYMALVSGLLGHGIANWGLKYATVSYSAIFSYLAPVFTIPIAFIVLNEVPTIPSLIGASTIAVGVLVAEFKANKK